MCVCRKKRTLARMLSVLDFFQCNNPAHQPHAPPSCQLPTTSHHLGQQKLKGERPNPTETVLSNKISRNKRVLSFKAKAVLENH